MASLARFIILEARHLTFAHRSTTALAHVQSSQPPFLNQLTPKKVSIVSKLIINVMDSINMALIVHRVNDPKRNMLVDKQWEVSDPILSFSNL